MADAEADPERHHTAGGVVVHGHRVLLLRKRANDEWRLPKGHVDSGEAEAESALREVAEETGFADLTLVADLGEATVRYRLGLRLAERRERYYRMALGSFARRPRSAKDAARFAVCWLPLDQALRTLSFEEERRWLHLATADDQAVSAP